MSDRNVKYLERLKKQVGLKGRYKESKRQGYAPGTFPTRPVDNRITESDKLKAIVDKLKPIMDPLHINNFITSVKSLGQNNFELLYRFINPFTDALKGQKGLTETMIGSAWKRYNDKVIKITKETGIVPVITYGKKKYSVVLTGPDPLDEWKKSIKETLLLEAYIQYSSTPRVFDAIFDYIMRVKYASSEQDMFMYMFGTIEEVKLADPADCIGQDCFIVSETPVDFKVNKVKITDIDFDANRFKTLTVDPNVDDTILCMRRTLRAFIAMGIFPEFIDEFNRR